MSNQFYVMGFTDKEMTLLRYALAKASKTTKQETRREEYLDLHKRICITQISVDDEAIEPLTVTGD